MATVNEITTAEQLWKATNLGRCELVRGELIQMVPTGGDHGEFEGNIGLELKAFVRKRKLGKVYFGEVGFWLSRNPDTVRGADVAFICNERVPPRGKRGFIEIPPDLVIEILSPDDRPGEVLTNVSDWLDGGCRVAWVADPDREAVFVYRSGCSPQRLISTDTLTEPDLLAGFSLPVADIFAE